MTLRGRSSLRWIWAGIPVAALAGYLGWAYLTLYQLDEAVRRQDNAALNELVDWNSVAHRLEDDLSEIFQSATGDEGEEPSDLDALLGFFSNLLINPIAHFYASPEGLAYLLNAQIILENPQELLNEDFPDDDTWFDHVRIAYPIGIASFRAEIVFPEGKDRALDGEPLVLDFRFQDFRWQLVRVGLPLEALGEEADGAG